MNQQRKQSVLLPLATLIGTAVAGVCLALFYLFNTDATSVDGVYTTLLFRRGLPLTALILFFLLFGILLAVMPLVLQKKKGLSVEPSEKEGAGLIFSRCCAGVGMLATTAMYFLLAPTATPYEQTAENGNLLLISLLCAVVGAFYFLLPALLPSTKRGVRFLLGVFALLFLGCELLLTHYFMLDFLASPTRVFAIFGFGSLMLFLLFELKALVPGRKAQGVKVSFALLSFFLNCADGFPRLILSIAGKGGFDVSLTSFHTLMRVLVAAYALASVLPFFLSASEKEEQEQSAPEEEKEEEEKHRELDGEEERTPFIEDDGKAPLAEEAQEQGSADSSAEDGFARPEKERDERALLPDSEDVQAPSDPVKDEDTEEQTTSTPEDAGSSAE